jgi:2-hydroxychromene-2-carboxylate isomerase
MAPEFEEQGGAATMDPSALSRWVSSKVVGRLASPATAARRRAKAERARQRARAPHRIDYFHQIEDGYSHLAAQLLRPLLDHYDVELVCHLVDVPADRNLPEPELLLPLSRYDSALVAPHYGLRFPENAEAPKPALISMAARILAAVDQEDFPDAAVAVGDALWVGDAGAMDKLAALHGSADRVSAEAHVARGAERRAKLGHYSGAMFHYGGEWFWGADRFYHLERRLIEVGARRESAAGDDPALLCPRPAIETGPRKDDGALSLEVYASLRSPYTSIIFDTAVKLAADTGVRLVMRPVLPMVMRGVSVTRTKGMYIFTDTGREAAARGLGWGAFYDPICQPVRNCYSLYPWADEQGRGTELLASFMRRAFFEGVNTNNDAGMRAVVEGAGLDWAEARGVMGNRDWEPLLEANRLAMYDFGSWGVPSFRLLDETGEPVLALWGQDRLWLFAREIQRLLGERQA